MDLAAEQIGELLSRRFADRANAGTALAQDDRFLAVARDEDLLMDCGRSIRPLFELLGLDRTSYGNSA